MIPGINIVHCQTNQGFTHITFIKEPKLESKEWKTSYCIPQEVGRPDSWGTKNKGGGGKVFRSAVFHIKVPSVPDPLPGLCNCDGGCCGLLQGLEPHHGHQQCGGLWPLHPPPRGHHPQVYYI